MSPDLIDLARECGGIRGGTFDAVKTWAFTEEGLAKFATRLAEAPKGWPDGLLDRVKAAAQRVQNNECPRRIPADPTDVDLVLAEVQALLEGRKPPFWLPPAPDAAPAASSPEAADERAELQRIHEVVMNVGGDWPDDERDPYTLRHVKWMAREINKRTQA